ncbi:MAG TPA: DUF973 family protein [Thermoplasmata archaeon]|nr:DUF973 family protein [Thermoplasmata archaeon]
MDGPAQTVSTEPSARALDAQAGFRQLKVASVVGLLGQILIWGSAIALWVVGALYAPIPVSTSIAYGANGFLVSAGAVFALNDVLIAGAVVAVLSIVLSARSYQKLGKATPSVKFDSVVAMTTIGAIGLGMFALGWAAWLGSFVAPGTGPNGDTTTYVPILASNLGDVVNLLLIVGGLLAFLGMLGIALGSSKVGVTYEEGVVELGGALTILPVFSVIGYALSLLGLVRGERKLKRGWTPPPPPPPPTYPALTYGGGYAAGPPMAVPGQPGSWDGLAVVLVVVLVLLWVFILPISLIIGEGGLTKGPGGVPGGGGTNNSPPTPASSGGASSVAPLLLVGLAGTAILLPLAIARTRRKRQRAAAQPMAAPPPPPPPPPPPAREEDPLHHLV